MFRSRGIRALCPAKGLPGFRCNSLRSMLIKVLFRKGVRQFRSFFWSASGVSARRSLRDRRPPRGATATRSNRTNHLPPNAASPPWRCEPARPDQVTPHEKSSVTPCSDCFGWMRTRLRRGSGDRHQHSTGRERHAGLDESSADRRSGADDSARGSALGRVRGVVPTRHEARGLSGMRDHPVGQGISMACARVLLRRMRLRGGVHLHGAGAERADASTLQARIRRRP